MFPDQNQPQNPTPDPMQTPQPMPAGQESAAPAYTDQQPVAGPVQPLPADPSEPMMPPVSPQQQMSPEMPQPAMATPSEATYQAPPSPAPQTIAPAMSAPLSVQPAPVDSSQVGYVPPAMPLAPSPMMGNAPSSKGNMFKKLRILIAVVVGLGVLSGGGFILKDILFSGSSVQVKNLVAETQAGINFKRPKNWTKVDLGDANKKTFGSDGAAFTEGGKSIDLADQGVIVGGSSLDFDFDTLTADEQQQAVDQFLKGYQDASVVEDETCTQVSGLKAGVVSQPNYTKTLSVEFTCDKVKNRAVKLKVKFYIAIKGKTQHFVELVAIDKTWEKSSKAFDEMLSTFKPAN